MQVRFENYERCYPKRLKKFFQSNLNCRTYDKFIPNMDRAIVGNLPPEIIYFFPKKSRANDIKEFQNALAELSQHLRTTYYGVKNNMRDVYGKPSNALKQWMSDTSEMFNNRLARISRGQLTADIQYVDYGGFANVFKLSLMDKEGKKIMHDKALKVFYNIKETHPQLKHKHNNYAEANFWTFLKRAAGHKLDKTQFTKHYISDMHAGYALTEFADADITKTSSEFKFTNILGIIFQDYAYNIPIYGKMYDGGNFIKGENFIDDKVVLRYFKKLYYRSKTELPQVLANIETLARNPKTPNRDKIYKAIELFKKQKPVNN